MEQVLPRDLDRQKLLAEFGAFALACQDRGALLDDAVRRAAQAVGVSHALVAQYRRESGDFGVVAATGWGPGVVGRATLSADARSPAGMARAMRGPIVLPDPDRGLDRPGCALLDGHGLATTLTTPIPGGADVAGVVCLGSTHPRRFDTADIALVQELANLLGAAIRRMEVEIERDRLLTALSEGERRYRFMAECIPQIVWTADARGQVDFCNSRWSEYTGLSRELGIAKEWPQVIHPDDETRTMAAWEAAVRSGEGYECEHRIRRADGGYRWMLSRAWPLKDGQGRVERWFGTATDIDGEKQAQQALLAARDTAERANQAKSRFLAAASHDLRQPLNAVALLAGALRSRIRTADAQRILDAMEESLEAMIELFESIMDLSKLESGAVPLDVRPVELAPLLSRIARDFRPMAEAKGLRLRVVCSDAVVHSDATLLERILRNLVANAVRYTQTGGVVVGARRSEDGRLRVEVVDSGPGIPPDRLDEIFDEFQQLGNPARERRDGHGLGLAIVRRAAGLLGHGVTVRSTVGRGTTFAVVLPRADRPGSPCAPASRLRDGSPPPEVLLLEDDPLVLTATRLLLEDQGCRVIDAATGPEALALVEAGERPGLVLADFRLPGPMDGLETVRRLRQVLGGDVPAALITGDVTADVEPRARAARVRFLRKPVRPEDLNALLRTAAG